MAESPTGGLAMDVTSRRRRASAETYISPEVPRVNWNDAPPVGLFEAQMRPPVELMIERAMDSPMPIPSGLVV